METLKYPTHQIKLYLSGPIEVAKQVVRKFCFYQGLCVTVEPTTYIYTGGEEQGYVVGLLNYPRFPSHPRGLEETADRLAITLLEQTYQKSVLIVGPDESKWLSVHDEAGVGK